MIKANIKVGNASIQVEAETQVQLVEAAGFWGEIPQECGNCKSPKMGFFSRNPQGNLYVGLKCQDCGYELNFGQNKDGGKLFVKDEWKAPWKPDGDYQPTSAGGSAVDDDDDIPF